MLQYCRGITTVHAGGITSVQWGIHQYYGGYSVLWRDTFSTVGDNSSTWGIASALWGIPSVLCRLFSTVGIRSVQWRIASVLWKVFGTLGDNISTVGLPLILWGITSVLWRLLNTVEIRLEILRNFEESLNLFQKLISLDRPHRKPQVFTTVDMVKDLGYKNLVLGAVFFL